MAHGDAREGRWRGNWWMEWVTSTLHTTSEHGVSSITTADAHTSAASSRLNWRPLAADLNGLVRFAERRNLVSARVPSHFNWPLITVTVWDPTARIQNYEFTDVTFNLLSHIAGSPTRVNSDRNMHLLCLDGPHRFAIHCSTAQRDEFYKIRAPAGFEPRSYTSCT